MANIVLGNVMGAAAVTPSTPLATAATATASPQQGGGDFSAALAAAREAAERKAAANQDLQIILKKGFVAFARDTLAASLRAKMRQQAMAALNINEAQLDSLPPAARNAVEQRLREMIQQLLDQEAAAQTGASPNSGGDGTTGSAGSPPAQTAASGSAGGSVPSPSPPASPSASPLGPDQTSAPATAANTGPTPGGTADATGQKKPPGENCLVIPILAWPGGPSLLG